MDEYIVHCKATEYLNRFCASSRMRKQEKARKLACTTLVMLRQESRIAHTKAENLWEEIRGMKRSIKKMNADGVTFPFGEARIKVLEQEFDTAEKELRRVGGEICAVLDLWQLNGATFEDLCNLCNRDPVQVKEEIGEDDLKESFSKLATVYNLDYKNPQDTGWLEDSVDAPLTHALKAFLLDTMLHTEAGRKASHEALQAVFPEIMENALTMYTDADGVQHLIDKDGVEVATLDGKEDQP